MKAGERFGLLFGTVRHLRPRQLVNRITRRWVGPPRPAHAPPLRTPGARLGTPPLATSISFLGDGRFRFLNEERRILPAEYGSPREGLLWDYNFHYFDGLAAPEPDPEAKRAWIAEWLRHVPVGARPAWDPYPSSRRIVNWILWAMASGQTLPDGGEESLAAQARYLERRLEYHLMANHLLANAVALTAAGAWFGGDEGRRWLDKGSRLLVQELQEQFLADGGHYELSPTYQAVILADLLNLVQIGRGTGCHRIEHSIVDTARRAVGWLVTMRRPDGRLPLFNDAAYDQAPDVDSLLAYAGEVVGPVPEAAGSGLRVLGPSGYFAFKQDRLFVVGDVGPLGPTYQPGHGHCDMLGFELCWDGRPVVVDTGTSTYETGALRTRERGTAAHNTVQVGDGEQSEIWASFRVARRATVESVEEVEEGVSARIRAFPPGWARLERSWRFVGETTRIRDRVLETRRSGGGTTARLHFHPDVSLTGGGMRWEADGLQVAFEGAVGVRNVEYLYAPEFNVRIPGRCLEADFDGELLTVLGP